MNVRRHDHPRSQQVSFSVEVFQCSVYKASHLRPAQPAPVRFPLSRYSYYLAEVIPLDLLGSIGCRRGGMRRRRCLFHTRQASQSKRPFALNLIEDLFSAANQPTGTSQNSSLLHV